ncbi:50S ribosomal protein L3 [Patescibacteria group bacterium]|nr:50S ribosomal protein L3 [Patescibacteria group bacterium]
MKAILGLKQDMTQLFSEEGKVVPVTLVDTTDCFVCGIRDKEKDGYNATILGLKKKRKPLKLENAKYRDSFVPMYVKEVPFIDDRKIKDKLDANMFDIGEKVVITGISKGKGFAGVVKRWNFAGGPRTHGQSNKERHGGSIGAGTTPGRVYKGKKMGGRMGGDTKTVKMKVIDIKDNIIALKGAIPGGRGSLVVIKGEI